MASEMNIWRQGQDILTPGAIHPGRLFYPASMGFITHGVRCVCDLPTSVCNALIAFVHLGYTDGRERHHNLNQMNTSTAVSHAFSEESQEAKARWFQSLTLQARMEMLCAFTDMILSVTPRIVEHQRTANPVAGRILVLSQP